ncbi:MAG: threonine--tRNA ligase [Chloroflexi bacterium]|nr:threonine--tRNA ligase [Chloroflexota bacterium]
MSEHQQAPDLERMRHSASHVMAEAVQEIVPGAKLGIGPAIDTGFYYDFDLPRPLTQEDLKAIEERMAEIIKGRYPFQRTEVTREEALKLFADQPYKQELIRELPEDEVISVYKHHNFMDLCRGPHVEHTGQVPMKGIKLLNIAGAYWRGDEKRPMLQRIYGAAFPNRQELDNYIHFLEEVERRDHRRLGQELDLYSMHELGGPGLVYWHPKGALIRETIENFWRQEHRKRGYDLVYTPHIGKLDLWKTSGHWGFYRESMYAPMVVDDVEYLLKPMNCPFHILMYNTRTHSYREMPMRWGELGTVYRYERSGVLQGMLRVRGFTQDDAHIFCRPDQLENELVSVIELARFMLQTFGYKEYDIELSVRDPLNKAKYVGDDASWEMAETALVNALHATNLAYKRVEGEAKFYGPAIDIKVRDALGRGWQGPTIQVDFNEPERFDVNYVGEDGQPHRVVMVHRTVVGSMERFVAGLIEHYAGAFPVWLAPVQATVIPIADRHNDYAWEVAKRLKAEGFRVEVDDRSERMNAKIRDAQMQKVPYMLVAGDREAGEGTLAVRRRDGQNPGTISVDAFLEMLRGDVASKVIF